MLNFIKTKISSLINAVENFMFDREPECNTYCIPCTWVIKGKTYIDAPNADVAKAYARTQKIYPDLEDCYCSNMKPDTEHPILCECGYCGNEYIISKYHTPNECPFCKNGGAKK